MNLSVITSGLAIVFLLTGCEKELDFKYHYIEPLIVIEGELSPENGKVSLTQTTPMGEPMDRKRLTDAEVTIEDLNTGEISILTPDKDGYFVTSTGGTIGHDYRLKVTRDGEIWTSETTMYPPVEILSLGFSWIKMPYDYVAVMQTLYVDNPSTAKDCYWIRIYRNGEIYSWSEQEDRTSSGGIMNFVTMTSRRDIDKEDESDVLRDGDLVTVKICQIPYEMRNWLEAIGNDSSGPELFISSGGARALGYFLATSPVESTIVYQPEEMKIQ